MRRFILDLWYRVRSPMFWTAVLIGAAAFFLGGVDGSGMIFNPKDDGLINIYGELIDGLITVIAPCAAVLPNIKRMIGFRGELGKYERMRSADTTRMIGEMGVSAVSGGFALMLGPLLVMLLFAIKYPTMLGRWTVDIVYVMDIEANASFSDLLRAGHYGMFLAAKMSLLFLFGMSMNAIAFVLNMFISDSFVLAFVPMMLQETIAIWFSRFTWLCNMQVYITGFCIMLPCSNTGGFWLSLFAVHCGVWLLSFAAAKSRMDRRKQYE